MNNKEITNAIADLYRATNTLEELYIENGGEVTEEAAEKEEQIEAIKALLTGEGIDSLGRWLAGKEQEKALLKAEKAALDRRIKAVDGTIDYIKYQVGQVLRATGCEKAKGLAYSFAQATSTKTEVAKDVLEMHYATKISNAILAAGVPGYIGFSLTASSTKANEIGLIEGDEDIFVTTEKPTCRFTKPRTVKEEN